MGADVLLGGFFQFGYVTRDLDAATAHYGGLGVSRFMAFESRVGGHPIKVALAWAGETMIELIQPLGEPSPLYAVALPGAGETVRLHHLGYQVRDESRWKAVQAALEARSIPIAARGAAGGPIEYFYADARPQTGFHVEYIWTKTENPPYLSEAPRN